MSPHFTGCPLKKDFKDIEDAAKTLRRVLRTTRRDVLGCPACPQFETCQLHKEVNAIIAAALDTVSEEWSRDAS